jgi:hypothetical protein
MIVEPRLKIQPISMACQPYPAKGWGILNILQKKMVDPTRKLINDNIIPKINIKSPIEVRQYCNQFSRSWLEQCLACNLGKIKPNKNK